MPGAVHHLDCHRCCCRFSVSNDSFNALYSGVVLNYGQHGRTVMEIYSTRAITMLVVMLNSCGDLWSCVFIMFRNGCR